MVTDPRDSSPYVGPRPFSAADRAVFFGRTAEVAQLISLVIANRHVLLYAVSGAGKTSLLRAGLIPALREEGFDTIPPLRLQAPDPPRDARNAFVYAALSRLLNEPDAPAGEQLDPAGTLTAFLGSLARGRDRYGFASPRLLVFDQLEELFTLYPDRWQHREAFLQEIADACEHDETLRVVFSLREEYAAQLERFSHVLPGALRARFHLDRLREQPALAAVTEPLAMRGVSFAPGVAERLIGNLQETRIDLGHGQAVAVEGEFVEPVHLQVVCRSLWERLEPGVQEVSAADLAALGSVDESLTRYFEEAVGAAAARAHMRAYALREALEQSFITSAGTRATVFAGTEETAHLPAAALEELAARHLIRAEWRAGGRWFELAHDRLIRPIRDSNARIRDRRRRRNRRRLWALASLAPVLAVVLVILGSSRVGNVVTPGVVGAASVSEAERKLQQYGLELGVVTERVTPDVPPGSIIEQSPPSGTSVTKGSPVSVLVAVGERRVTVPRVIGSTVAKARAELDAQGLRIKLAPGPRERLALINGQDPSAGEMVNGGSSVQVFLPQPTPTPPPQPEADFAVETLGIDQIGDDVVVTVAVRNLGEGDSPPTLAIANVTDLAPVRTKVPPLSAGTAQQLQIHVPITDAVRGRSVFGAVTVDPDDAVPELNETNNTDRTGGLAIPG